MSLIVRSIISALCLVIISSTSPFAHKVNVFAYFEGETIIVEGYFSKDSKAKNCTALLYDQTGKKIHSGKTNEKGIYSIDASKLSPLKGDITVILDTGDGHRASYKLPLEEAPSSIVKAGESSEQTQNPDVKDAESTEQGNEPQPALTSAVSDKGLQRLEKTVQRIVAEENAKTMKMISNVQRLILEERDSGPSARDVVGGLGWILGLLGITAYFLSQKK